MRLNLIIIFGDFMLKLCCVWLFSFSASCLLASAHYQVLEGVKGATTSEVREYRENGKLSIGKVFSDSAVFQEELAKILELEPFVNEYEKIRTQGQFLPKIARYESHEHNQIRYEKALGESFFDFLVRVSIVDIQMPDTKTTLLKQLKNAGVALGNFHAIFRDITSVDKLMTIIHGDLHLSNVFFNFYDGTVTFIDYSSMSFKEKKDAQIDIDKFFHFSDLHLTGAIGKKLASLSPLVKEQDFQASQARLREYKSAIAEGYNQALLAHNTGFRLVLRQSDNHYTLERAVR